MSKQLDLWLKKEQTTHTSKIWQTLDQQQKKETVAILAQMIRKIVLQQKPVKEQEVQND